MSGALSKTWWLLALCGIFDAMHAAMNLLTLNPSGALSMRRFALPGAVWNMGILAIAAGVCVIAAALWSSGNDNSWLLALHGLALGAFGLICAPPLIRAPLSFHPVSLLFVVMAVSFGAFALTTARTLRRVSRGKGRWFLLAVGAAFIGFAVSFIVVGGFRIRLEPPQIYFIWMSFYLSLCAMFMMWLAFRVRRWGIEQPGQADPFLPRQAQFKRIRS